MLYQRDALERVLAFVNARGSAYSRMGGAAGTSPRACTSSDSSNQCNEGERP